MTKSSSTATSRSAAVCGIGNRRRSCAASICRLTATTTEANTSSTTLKTCQSSSKAATNRIARAQVGTNKGAMRCSSGRAFEGAGSDEEDSGATDIRVRGLRRCSDNGSRQMNSLCNRRAKVDGKRVSTGADDNHW
jgi:hypothetical protein